MLRASAAELFRFRTTALIGAGVMAAFTALITLLTFVGFDEMADRREVRGPAWFTDLASVDGLTAGLSSAATMIGVVALALCATSVARDYELGTIGQLLVAEPRRVLVLSGKLLALVATVVVGVAGSAIVGMATAFVSAPIADVDTAAWTSGAAASAALSTTVNVATATVVWGFAGAALAMVTRSASTAITVGIGYLLVGEPLLNLVWSTSSDWLVSGTLTTFTRGGTVLVSYGRSAILLTMYGAAFVVVTFVVFSHRDVTD